MFKKFKTKLSALTLQIRPYHTVLLYVESADSFLALGSHTVEYSKFKLKPFPEHLILSQVAQVSHDHSIWSYIPPMTPEQVPFTQ